MLKSQQIDSQHDATCEESEVEGEGEGPARVVRDRALAVQLDGDMILNTTVYSNIKNNSILS